MFKLLLLLVALTAVWGIPHRDSFHSRKSGRPIPGTRIVGGEDADIADYPYHLILTRNKVRTCGASILAPNWALTTAYCTIYTKAEELAVIAGYSPATGGQTVDVAVIHQHPDFDMNTFEYDISILELAENITVANSAPIALHDAGFVIAGGTYVTITGWGEIDAEGTYAEALQVVVTKVISMEICEETYGRALQDSMMCVGNWKKGGESPCYGDFGDPVVFEGKLYAIASWSGFTGSQNCTSPRLPFVNLRLTYKYIRKYIKGITGL